MKKLFFFFSFLLNYSAVYSQQAKHRVEYDLYIDQLEVNFSGKKRMALAINGTIPGPVLHFTEGDTAIIRVHNKLNNQETSTHWHGLLVPNEQDGVPDLTTAAIKAGETHTFTFPLIQSGTYWYHSHTMLQEQSGIYGSIVIHPKNWKTEKEEVLMLSDWTDENPYEVLRNLKRGLDWYSIRKNSVQSWGEAIAKGYGKDRTKMEWQRMPAMDLSDVLYNKFLINGKSESSLANAKPGETVRLRVINGGASTYFWLQYAGGTMKIVAADGLPIQPVEVDKMLIAIAETYDVEIKIPDDGMAYEFRATAQDISGHASLFTGEGMKMKAPDLPKFDYFAMMREMNSMTGMKMGDMKGMTDVPPDRDIKRGGEKNKGHGMGTMKMDMPIKDSSSMNKKMNSSMMPMDKSKKSMDGIDMGTTDEKVFSYDMLRSLKATTLKKDRPVREIKLTLTGNMLRYLWSFDNKTLSQSDIITIRKGENVRMVLVNNTMMEHPLHLHGHFFRLLNEQGEYSPLKHTFDIPPMETVTIEFEADQEKSWIFHCHILYHMMAGMSRVLTYENSAANMQVTAKDQQKAINGDKILYFWAQTKIASNGVFGFVNLSGNKSILGATYRVSYKNQYEFQPDYQRFLDKRQFLSAFIGADIRNTFQVVEEGRSMDRKVGVFGLRYLLPMFLLTELRLDHKGEVRFQLSRNDIPITRRLRLSLSANTDKEFNVDFDYSIAKRFYIHAAYDSDYKFGGGLTILW